MSRFRWLTQDEIKFRSITLFSARDVAVEHWQQIADATDRQLRIAPQSLISAKHCGLCIYFEAKSIDSRRKCFPCPYYCGITSLWNSAFQAWKSGNPVRLREVAKLIVMELKALEIS